MRILDHFKMVCSILQIVGFIALFFSVPNMSPLVFRLIVIGGAAAFIRAILPERNWMDLVAGVCGLALVGMAILRLRS